MKKNIYQKIYIFQILNNKHLISIQRYDLIGVKGCDWNSMSGMMSKLINLIYHKL